MRRKISLYIDGHLADLDEQNLVLFNYTQEELQEPGVVRNAYSHQVTLPGTPANNRIFGSYFRPDRQTDEGFRAISRTPFVIYNELSEVLESGYLKLDSVETKGRNIHSYKVSLYGGLGGYFYALGFDEDGNPLNLGDLEYQDLDGDSFIPNETDMALTAETLYNCWATLRDGFSRRQCPWANTINFAPCYNGFPADFDAKKVLVSEYQFLGIERSGVSGVNDLPHPQSGGCYVVTMDTDKDADEMRDYRAYLQRPVLSVPSFLDALENRGGITISAGIRAIIGLDLWITLSLPVRTGEYANYSMSGLFEGSMSPTDLLLSLAKTFGFVFLNTPEGVEFMTRDEFYSDGEEVDLSSRIEAKDHALSPLTFDAKWYSWKNDIKGSFAERHQQTYGRVYGEQRVNTGYEFNSETRDSLKGLKARGAAMLLKRSTMFQYAGGTKGIFPAAFFEGVTFAGYNQAGTDSTNIDVPHFPPYQGTITYYNPDLELYDSREKPEFADKDGKPVDGSAVLLRFLGSQELPRISSDPMYDKLRWQVSDDDQDILDLLNEGKPCWDMRLNNNNRLYNLPVFSRWTEDESLDFGVPAELGVPDASYPLETVYARYWAAYVSDRWDEDTTILRCKVDLSGLKVSPALFRNFYWYGNSWWALNKISNHSLTTYDLTECEFVRVQDRTNYTNGQ